MWHDSPSRVFSAETTRRVVLQYFVVDEVTNPAVSKQMKGLVTSSTTEVVLIVARRATRNAHVCVHVGFRTTVEMRCWDPSLFYTSTRNPVRPICGFVALPILCLRLWSR